jgi:hypothetical protein
VEPAEHTIFITAGDTIDLSFGVYLNDVPFDMTGYVLDAKVVDKYGAITKTWASDDVNPCFIIATTGFNLYDVTGFSIPDNYNADLQLSSGVEVMTIDKWNILVQPQITT